MNQELDYAEMLEIPVSTVNVVKKKSLFKRRRKEAPVEEVNEADLKELVVDSVNERVGAYVYAEDLSETPKPEKKKINVLGSDRGSRVICTELIAVCVLAAAIFLTNVFMPSSAINTFIGSLTSKTPAVVEPAYSEIKLSAVISERSDAEVTMTDNGVLCFTADTGVYPVCAGTIASVAEDNGLYTVKISHTSTFSSVITGLKTVYVAKGDNVKANLPFAYSDGKSEVRVSMYDGETLLNCYKLSGEVPVWNS